MAGRTTPPFRADHVGSLLRPPELLRARDEAAAGRLDADELRAVEDEAIREAVRLQEEVGPARGDRRRAPPRLLAHGLHLPARRHQRRKPATSRVTFHSEHGDIEFTPAALHVDGRLGVSKTIFGDDFRFLQETRDDATFRS